VLDRVDENGMVSAVQKALAARDLDPRDFLIRGPGGFLAFLAADVPVLAWQARTHARGWDGVLADLERNPSLLHLLHRCVSALAGVLAVGLLYRVVRREFGAASALCAAGLLAVLYQHVQDSHLGGVDTLWALCTLGAVGGMLRLVREPRARAYFGAGLAAGFAVAMKYFAVLLAPALVLAHLAARAEARREGRAPPPFTRLVLAAAAVPLGFVALFPGIFGAFGHMRATVSAAAGFSSPAWTLAALFEKVRTHLLYSFGVGVGESALALALVGLLLLWRRDARARLFVQVVAVLLAGLLLTRNSPPRYAEPLQVLFAGAGGIALAALLARAPRTLAPLALAVALAPSLVRSACFDRLVARRDTRLDVLDELARRAVPRDQVLAFGSAFGMPRPATGVAPYKTLRRLMYGAPWRKENRTEAQARVQLAKVLAHPPRLVLWNQAGAVLFPGKEQLFELLRQRYRVVLAVDGRTGAARLPDPVTMDMVPYCRPWLMERPGAPLALYERIDPPAPAMRRP